LVTTILIFQPITIRQPEVHITSIMGPSYYSFEYGPAHFIVLDNARFMIRESDNHRYYRPELDADQLAFVENELARIDKNKLLVVMMHIPWDDRGWNMEQRNKLMGLLSEHPNALSLGAHWHRHYHSFLGTDYGFTGDDPHHMISLRGSLRRLVERHAG
jgi:hypothetical protein